MLKTIFFTMLIISTHVFAQTPPKFDPQQMQNMMLQVQKMQACMQNIDQTVLKDIEKKGKKLKTEIKRLCVAGNKSEAQKKARAFAKQALENKSLKELKKCTKSMESLIPQLSKAMAIYESDDPKDHVCNLLN